jgi:hypothetical protein
MTDLEEYTSLFENADAESAVGEASVEYFHCKDSARRIEEQIQEATILLLLRDPAERAYSHYNMLREHGVIPNRPFIEALREAEDKGSFEYTGVPTSRYAAGLRRYKNVFGSRLHVYLHRDLKSRPLDTVQEIFGDIGVDPEYRIDPSRNYNKTKVPKSSVVNQFVWSTSTVKDGVKAVLPEWVADQLRELLTTVNRDPPPPLSTEARQFVVNKLRDDIVETEELIDRDLADWKR